MADSGARALEVEVLSRAVSLWIRRAAGLGVRLLHTVGRFSKRNPLGAVGLGIILFLVVMAAAGPFVTPYDPAQIGAASKQASVSWCTPPLTWPWDCWDDNVLGGDHLGRDILSRILHGAWISLLVGVAASIAGTLGGGLLGLAAGYWGGRIDALLSRLIDILMAFPAFVLALALLTVMERSLSTLILAIAVPYIPFGARVVRASTLVIKETQYVEAARAIGASDLRIIFFHVAPGCIAPYIVLMTGLIGVAIIIESALGFLGLGIPPPTPTWGGMLADAQTAGRLFSAPHLGIVPGMFITLAVFAFSVFGDSLRDVLDPRLRGSR